MDTTSLFTAALQLPDPWRVSGVEFRDEEDGRRELHIAIGFAAGSRFPCPEPGCGEAACPVHDARERVWRHLNFCVCSIESGPCERVDVFHVSGRFWSTSACGEKRTPARPAWTSFPS